MKEQAAAVCLALSLHWHGSQVRPSSSSTQSCQGFVCM